ncbi:MAG: succinylglutamate desuccinylase/aspartoacylase family protein [Rhodospirillales bacterium]|nr:succinylglutamate desuccinylase/aspartoacylase family protein [Rhodospirillales bacterium]
MRTAPTPLPPFAVRIAAPDIAPWREGNCGIEGVTQRSAAEPGPHVVLMALTHGNELAGAIVLDRLLRQGLAPLCGRISFIFANLAAFDRFDARHPTASRFVEEDLNRVWDPALLDGPRRSVELDRARRLRPLLESADVVLDLHSMLWPADPLILCGMSAQGMRLASMIGVPGLVVADHGHANGRRLIDAPRFNATDGALERRPVALLIEAGQHWEPETVRVAEAAAARLLGLLGMRPLPPGRCARPRRAEVTHAICAASADFAFARAFHGGEVIGPRNTLIAHDGAAEIRTPYENCLLVMPSLRPGRGHTAVRLARFLPA